MKRVVHECDVCGREWPRDTFATNASIVVLKCKRPDPFEGGWNRGRFILCTDCAKEIGERVRESSEKGKATG